MNTLVTSQYQPKLSNITKIFSRRITQSNWNIQIKLNYYRIKTIHTHIVTWRYNIAMTYVTFNSRNKKCHSIFVFSPCGSYALSFLIQNDSFTFLWILSPCTWSIPKTLKLSTLWSIWQNWFSTGSSIFPVRIFEKLSSMRWYKVSPVCPTYIFLSHFVQKIQYITLTLLQFIFTWIINVCPPLSSNVMDSNKYLHNAQLFQHRVHPFCLL